MLACAFPAIPVLVRAISPRHNPADATLLLRVTGKPAGAAPPAGLRVHRAVLGAHSEHFRTQVLRWADGESQRAADFQPAIAVAHFIEASGLPVGLTVHQLAQVCKEAKAREKLHCAEACSQAMMALAWKEADKAQAVLPCLEETFDNLEMCDAAHLVVLCMYKGKLAEEVEDPLTLARVCRVAERWAFSSLSSSCLQRLADLPPSQLPGEQLVLVLQTLPDSCALLPEHKKWQELALCRILSLYGDVHAVITSAQLRTTFQQLPFAAVQQWAGSDALTVDSENSVVELISLWLAGPGGQACSKEQKQQLSCLVRVQHLSPAYAIGRLPALDWFDIPCAPTPSVAQAACCGYGMTGVLSRSPPAWFEAPRKPIHPVDLLKRTTIRWDVPRQQLVELLASKDLAAMVWSEPVYSAGAGWRVCLNLNKATKDEPGFTLGCFGHLVTYAECKGHALGAKLPYGSPIKQVITKGYRLGYIITVYWVNDGLGSSSLLGVRITTDADLEPFLDEGCLPIRANFQAMHRPCE
ncbi:hypothetical protein QJQ45_000705 [Haematococcus lacustris]|nr:hypothetical protein QJQ45_000705 [Haematococcus lacustris]